MLITRAAPIFFKMLFSFNKSKEIINLNTNLFIASIYQRNLSSAMSTDYSQNNQVPRCTVQGRFGSLN